MKLHTLAITVLLISTASCSVGPNEPGGTQNPAASPPAQPSAPQSRAGSTGTAGLSFSAVQHDVFEPKCVGCHTGPNARAGVDLSSYSSIMTYSEFPPLVAPGKPEDSLIFQITSSGEMPPGGKLSDSELQEIHDWIAQGALGQSGSADSSGGTSSARDSAAEGFARIEPCDAATVPGEPGARPCSEDDLTGRSIRGGL